MHLPHAAMLLRIFLGEKDRWEHRPLYEAIVLKARELHLAGATVLRGPMGFGKTSRLHTAKILRLSMDLPLVIEIVDTEEKINAFLPLLDTMMTGGLITLEKVRVIDYRAGKIHRHKLEAIFMTENIWYIAAIWMGLAFLASLISIRVGISVALIEILVGVAAGNIHFAGGQHILQTTDWTNFLAMLGSGVLTFLAGAEIDPVSLRANLRASMTIGILSFALPFLAVWAFAQFVLGWPLHQAQIAGIALSTTSVAVVYAVMIEGGQGETPLGKTILAACFITDFGTVLALGTLFANFDIWLLVFVVVMSVMLWYMPTWTRFLIAKLGATRVSEPEVKFIFLVLFFLGGLASTAKSEAVLPAYLVGLVIAGVFLRDKTLVHRMRTIAFTIFTPFYFIKAGLFVSLPAMWTSLGLIAILLLIKMVTKYIGVWPATKMFYMRNREANYTTLLMATGLTFGTISSLFGLQHKIIDQTQYTILVTVVILSAFVPTLIAQKFFQPAIETMIEWGKIYSEKINARKNTPTSDAGATGK